MTYAPNAEARIIEFLDEHPRGRLFVLTGYASVWGLAWLHRRTIGRPVTLIIGDARQSWFDKAAEEDKETALEFLDRRDVQVMNWYSKNTPGREDIAHAKAWIVRDSGKSAVLLGSANLTKKGFRHNFEMMAMAADRETPKLLAALEEINSKAFPTAKNRIKGYLESEDTTTRYSKQGQPGHRYQTGSPKRGCLSAFGLTVLTAAFLILGAAIVALLG